MGMVKRDVVLSLRAGLDVRARENDVLREERDAARSQQQRVVGVDEVESLIERMNREIIEQMAPAKTPARARAVPKPE